MAEPEAPQDVLAGRSRKDIGPLGRSEASKKPVLPHFSTLISPFIEQENILKIICILVLTLNLSWVE
jgi:hypothetical protein